ncbi:hybrid sensor histidine kinase/response regulator [Barnesiella intestinihominis]|uniref:hybrid sensor histidine kinase/response regulator n=1 Tax=Barnesiella intestinihominis TaxID=487174 RepID=UPI003AB7C15B
MKILLQYKILFGYILLMIIIGCMAAVLFHERHRIHEIEEDANAIRLVRREINNIHRHITDLALSGESVMAWEQADYESYHEDRLDVDILLQDLQRSHGDFVLSDQIDTLRNLLEDKETHLLHIMEAYHRQEIADSLLLHRLPVETERVTSPRTITQKKKGIAGFFGKKETVQVPPSADAIRSLNERLITIQEERIRNIDAYSDSLQLQNKELNRKLHMLINTLNNHTQEVFQYREKHIEASHELSTRIITGLIIAALILLAIFYMVIQQDLKRDTRLRLKMEEIINKNHELLETRKNIILTISHDIRAPLNIINGCAELAADTRDRKRRNRHLANIGIVSRHILHLLNNLLDVYRLNESKETCNNVPFSLNDLLERIATGFSHVVNNKGILFLCDFKDTDVVLHGDVDRIEQIIDNLLANAVKFTETGTIHFNAAYKDGNLSLEIKDTGIGMDENTLSRIFRPFERLASETNADGFGLGLPITQGLVNLLGGKIYVESEIGCGSTFRVSLPLPPSDERIGYEAPALQATWSLPQSVLIIDNDRLQLEIVKEMLERNGVSCIACSNAKELVKEMRKRDYDLLLSDIQMPGTNGFEILNLLRNSNIGNSRTIPVIAMTARGDREKEAFVGSGFADCVYKPFSMNELLNTISAAMPHKEPEEPCAPDFDTFTADVRDKRKLLRTFISQSNRDIKDLRSAMEAEDRAGLREIAHKIQPSLELLQSYGPFYDFREMLKDETSGKEVIEEYTKRIIEHISMLVTAAENTINRMTHEKENTDS